MKRTIYLTLFFLAVLIAQSGCSLDEKLYGLTPTDGFVKTEDDATLIVNGVYANFQDFQSFKSTLAGLVLYSGDEFAFTGTVGTNMAGVWINRLITSSDAYVANSWNNLYAGVNKANSAMEAVAIASDIKPDIKNKLNGELTFLRAFSYYYLVRLFGGVPISTTATKPSDNFYKTRQSVDSVYAQIFRDFQNANRKCLLKSKQPTAEFGRATKGAAQAMLSQAYLTYANYLDLNGRSAEAQTNYQKAVNWSDSVLLSKEYSLISNYADLFDVAKERDAYKEVIYGIQFTRDALASGAGSKGSEWAYYTQPAERWAVCGNALPKGNGHGGTRIQPWFAEQYFTGNYSKDYRSEVTFLTSWSGFTTAATPVAKNYFCFPATSTVSSDQNVTMCFLNKYVDSEGYDQRNNDNNLIVIRFAEVYLIKAEALNELGRTTEAYAPFNELRKRARQANGTARTTPIDLTSGLDKENFRLAVFNERGLELVGEGQRFFDLVRMRYPNTNTTMMQWRMETFYPNLSATQKALPSWDSGSKTWKGGRVYTPSVVAWNVRFLLYPIPSAEFDSNPNIGSQNPGW